MSSSDNGRASVAPGSITELLIGKRKRDDTDPLVTLCKGRLGKVIQRKWRLDALIGVGGMAAVYAATHRNGTRAAIKMLHPTQADESTRERFAREAYLANSINHPGVVHVMDDDEAEDGASYLVMELLDGETLETFATHRVQLPPPEALLIGEQILDVLAAAHAKGIVHRDVKPENVFLCSDGRVKLLDFGVARVREISEVAPTQHGFLLGTPGYMAPEQARGETDRVDARTDVWAAGATMFRILAGRTAHRGASQIELLLAAAKSQAPKLREVAPVLPEPLAELIDKALEPEPDKRWRDAQEFLRALRKVQRQLGYVPDAQLRRSVRPDTTLVEKLPPPPTASTEFDRADALRELTADEARAVGMSEEDRAKIRKLLQQSRAERAARRASGARTPTPRAIDMNAPTLIDPRVPAMMRTTGETACLRLRHRAAWSLAAFSIALLLLVIVWRLAR